MKWMEVLKRMSDSQIDSLEDEEEDEEEKDEAKIWTMDKCFSTRPDQQMEEDKLKNVRKRSN